MYKFPIIKTIEDVLPHIEGRDEFYHAEREHYDVINYAVAFPDTFSTEEDGWEIRRECRGLIFDKQGRLISRPFHKFFNVNEKPEVHEGDLPVDHTHYVLNKEDGSMIRAFPVNGEVRLGTKMGITEIAEDAEAWLAKADGPRMQWLTFIIGLGYTPLFEFVGPGNQIVLDYDKTDLILTAIRHNETGVYVDHSDIVFQNAPFNKVESYGSVDGSLKDFIAIARQERDKEGNILFWPKTGQMVKIKNDWYVKLHKILDEVRSWHNVAAKMYDNELDDVLPKLDEAKREEIETFCRRLKSQEQIWVIGVKNIMVGIALAGWTKKDVALEFIPTLGENKKWLSRIIFSAMDGVDVEEAVRDMIVKSVNRKSNFEETLKRLGLHSYVQGEIDEQKAD